MSVEEGFVSRIAERLREDRKTYVSQRVTSTWSGKYGERFVCETTTAVTKTTLKPKANLTERYPDLVCPDTHNKCYVPIHREVHEFADTQSCGKEDEHLPSPRTTKKKLFILFTGPSACISRQNEGSVFAHVKSTVSSGL